MGRILHQNRKICWSRDIFHSPALSSQSYYCQLLTDLHSYSLFVKYTLQQVLLRFILFNRFVCNLKFSEFIRLNKKKIIRAISDKKDVDGLKSLEHLNTGTLKHMRIISPTVQAVLHLIKMSGKKLENINFTFGSSLTIENIIEIFAS